MSAKQTVLSTAETTQPTEFNILTITIDGLDSALNINIPMSLGGILFVTVLIIVFTRFSGAFKGFGAEEITVKEPFTGTQIKIKASAEDRKIAHRIWTELVTRKAAIPFQRDKDVIIDVYDSWHILFQCVREQVAAIPVEKLRGREKKDIENLIDVSTKVLNEGLRPHLTEWQAKYRSWYDAAKIDKRNKTISPQELQRRYPYYDQLVTDIETVNGKLQLFADELKKIVRGYPD